MTKREQILAMLDAIMRDPNDSYSVCDKARRIRAALLDDVLIVPKDKLDCIRYLDGLEIVPETGFELHKTLGEVCFYTEVIVSENDYNEKTKAEIEKDIRHRMEKYLESNKEVKK